MSHKNIEGNKRSIMKEYTFKGIDNKANVLGGIITFLVICIITAISFIIFHDYIKTLITAIFFIVLNGFIGVSVFLLLIAKSLNKVWLIKMYENGMEIYYNGVLKKKVNLESINSVMLATSEKRRYLKIIDDRNEKIVIQIQIYPLMDKNELNRFDDFSGYLAMHLDTFFNQEKSTSQGYLITNFYKNN